MRVLGVDPGLTRCGIGVVEGRPGRPLDLVAVGVIRTPTSDPTPRRLVSIEDTMTDWFERYRPESVAIERVFADTNVSTVVGTAQVTGVVMLLAERRGIPVTLHTPTEVKAAVSGNGRADKAQVTAMVTRLLRLERAPKPADAADALALAICHVWRGGTQNRLAEAAAAANSGSGAGASRIPRRAPAGAPTSRIPTQQALRPSPLSASSARPSDSRSNPSVPTSSPKSSPMSSRPSRPSRPSSGATHR